jgi:1,4-alpha-glucan branching enzyme
VAGDFNSWDAAATPMAHAGSGDLWIVRVELPRGVHLYSFVLDGREWRPDPSAPLAADDAFGGRNSVVVVNGAQPL